MPATSGSAILAALLLTFLAASVAARQPSWVDRCTQYRAKRAADPVVKWPRPTIGGSFWRPINFSRRVCVAERAHLGYRHSGDPSYHILIKVASRRRARLRACDEILRDDKDLEGNAKVTLKINRKGIITSWRATGDRRVRRVARCVGRALARAPFLPPQGGFHEATFVLGLGVLRAKPFDVVPVKQTFGGQIAVPGVKKLVARNTSERGADCSTKKDAVRRAACSLLDSGNRSFRYKRALDKKKTRPPALWPERRRKKEKSAFVITSERSFRTFVRYMPRKKKTITNVLTDARFDWDKERLIVALLDEPHPAPKIQKVVVTWDGTVHLAVEHPIYDKLRSAAKDVMTYHAVVVSDPRISESSNTFAHVVYVEGRRAQGRGSARTANAP